MARRAEGLGAAQDDLQPLCALEPVAGLRSDLRDAGRKRATARETDDRRHPYEGARRGGQPVQQKGLFPAVSCELCVA